MPAKKEPLTKAWAVLKDETTHTFGGLVAIQDTEAAAKEFAEMFDKVRSDTPNGGAFVRPIVDEYARRALGATGSSLRGRRIIFWDDRIHSSDEVVD